MGIAPRRLWGWEPKSTTEYEYDSDGRLIRSGTTRESEFDGEQVAYLIAIQEYERMFGQHGHPMHEATSEEANPTNYEGHWRYFGEGPFTDYAEKARLDAIDAYKRQFSKDDPPNMNGLIFTVSKRPYPPT